MFNSEAENNLRGNRLEHYKTIEPAEAVELQKKLQLQRNLQPLTTHPKLVAGADISFNLGSKMMHAAIIVLRLSDMQVVARSLASDETAFPYIPGLLAFREMPVLLKAWKQLALKPDVLILDGHGLAHPRRMGIATHFGIEVNHPTIGCAKNILVGDHEKLSSRKGSWSSLIDKEEKVGIALRSRESVKPIYVSPGHNISFEEAHKIVMKSVTRYKHPRTTRLAHQWANRLRKQEATPGSKIL